MDQSQQIFYVVLSADSGFGEMPEKWEAFSTSSVINEAWNRAARSPDSRSTTYVLAKVRWPSAKRDWQKSIRFIAWHGPIDFEWGGSAMTVGGVLEAAHPVIVKAVENWIARNQ